MTKVKICGITNLADALLCLKLGADEIGLNFYTQSKRYTSFEEAVVWVSQLPTPIRKVGVFVDVPICDILLPLSELELDAIQLHGDEDAEYIADLRIETDAQIIKAIKVKSSDDLHGISEYRADSILLDTFSAGEKGGTGEVFDWGLAALVSGEESLIYLAGGLNPDNVQEAIKMVRPYAVDVASGVESEPGKKDPEKLKAFIENAKSA